MTNNDPQFGINDMAVEFIDDARMEFPGLTDEAGASLEPREVPLGTLAAAGGYYSTGDDALYAFGVELAFVADSGEENENASVSISRGRFRPDRGQLRVDGVANVRDGTVALVEDGGNRKFRPGVPVDDEDGSWRCNAENEGWVDTDAPTVVAILDNSSGTEVARTGPFTPTTEREPPAGSDVAGDRRPPGPASVERTTLALAPLPTHSSALGRFSSLYSGRLGSPPADEHGDADDDREDVRRAAGRDGRRDCDGCRIGRERQH